MDLTYLAKDIPCLWGDSTLRIYSDNKENPAGSSFFFQYLPTGESISIDCGPGFGGMGMPNREAIRSQKIARHDEFLASRGVSRTQRHSILLSHGHMDHHDGMKSLARLRDLELITAPLGNYLVDQMDRGGPVSANQLQRTILTSPVGEVQRGSFRVIYGPVIHSLPQARFFIIEVPCRTRGVLRVLFMGETRTEEAQYTQTTYELNGELVRTSIYEMMVQTLQAYRPYHVVFLDGLRRGQPGTVPSEDVIIDPLKAIIAATDCDLYFPYLSSKAGITDAIVRQANDHGLGFGSRGASMHRFVGLWREHGWIPMVNRSQQHVSGQRRFLWSVTGSQAEPGSWLWQVAYDEKRRLEVPSNAMIPIFQGPIPMNREAIRQMLEIIAREVVPHGGIILNGYDKRHLGINGPNIYTFEHFTGKKMTRRSTSGHGTDGDLEKIQEVISDPSYPSEIIFYQDQSGKDKPVSDASEDMSDIEYGEDAAEMELPHMEDESAAQRLMREADEGLRHWGSPQ